MVSTYLRRNFPSTMRRIVSIAIGFFLFTGFAWFVASFLLIPGEFFELPFFLDSSEKPLHPASFRNLPGRIVTPLGRIDRDASNRYRDRLNELQRNAWRLSCKEETRHQARTACLLNLANLRFIAGKTFRNMPKSQKEWFLFQWNRFRFLAYEVIGIPRLGASLARETQDWRVLAALPNGRSIPAQPIYFSPKNLDSALEQSAYRLLSRPDIVCRESQEKGVLYFSSWFRRYGEVFDQRFSPDPRRVLRTVIPYLPPEILRELNHWPQHEMEIRFFSSACSVTKHSPNEPAATPKASQ